MERILNEIQRAVTLVRVIKIKNCTRNAVDNAGAGARAIPSGIFIIITLRHSYGSAIGFPLPSPLGCD